MKNNKVKKLHDALSAHIDLTWFEMISNGGKNVLSEDLKLSLLDLRLMHFREMERRLTIWSCQ